MKSFDTNKILWIENATKEEYEAAFDAYKCVFAIIENNTGRYILITDEPQDGYLHAAKIYHAGITNWHIQQREGSDKITREEPEDIHPQNWGF